MFKKIAAYLFNRNPIERIRPEHNKGWTKAIWTDHISRYEFAKKKMRAGTLLDIACGEGYGSAFLAQKATHVTGVDISSEVVSDAKKKYASHKNLTFETADALDFLKTTKKSYDTIICFETIEHIHDYRKFLFLVKKCLKESGVFIVSTPNKLFSDIFAGDTFNEFHLKEFYSQEFVDIVTQIFGVRPKVYLQRPVNKNRLILGTIQSFMFNKHAITKESDTHEGIYIILVVEKK